MARTSSKGTLPELRKTVRFPGLEGQRLQNAVSLEIAHRRRTVTCTDLIREGTMRFVERIERREKAKRAA